MYVVCTACIEYQYGLICYSEYNVVVFNSDNLHLVTALVVRLANTTNTTSYNITVDRTDLASMLSKTDIREENIPSVVVPIDAFLLASGSKALISLTVTVLRTIHQILPRRLDGSR